MSAKVSRHSHFVVAELVNLSIPLCNQSSCVPAYLNSCHETPNYLRRRYCQVNEFGSLEEHQKVRLETLTPYSQSHNRYGWDATWQPLPTPGSALETARLLRLEFHESEKRLPEYCRAYGDALKHLNGGSPGGPL